MVNAYDVPASDVIDAVAKELKKNEKIMPPEWMAYAKSGSHKERPPLQDDFWFIRGASILRKIYVNGNLGTQRLRAEFGGKKDRGSKRDHHAKAGGAVIRNLLQQLEEAGYLKAVKVKGRVITSQGQKLLDNTAYAVSIKPKTKAEVVKVVKEKAKELVEQVSDKKEEPKTKNQEPNPELKKPDKKS